MPPSDNESSPLKPGNTPVGGAIGSPQNGTAAPPQPLPRAAAAATVPRGSAPAAPRPSAPRASVPGPVPPKPSAAPAPKPEGPALGLGGTLQMDQSPLASLPPEIFAKAASPSAQPPPAGPTGTVQMGGAASSNLRAEAAALAAANASAVSAATSPPREPTPVPSASPFASTVAASGSTPTELGRQPLPSDPEMRAVIDHIGKTVGHQDPDQSLEIPPPHQIQAEDEEGEAKDPYIGTTFDHRYKIEELLGEGGMGFVYRARHKVIGKKVAIKVLRADLARDREITERFKQEAQAASSIGNAHIIDISDFGDLPDGSTYFVMEFLDGRSLASLIDSKVHLTVERICAITAQIADGLFAAHAGGIVHRDLKPDNIFLVPRGSDKDFVKILDFGIAKVTNDAGSKLTKAGAVFGTPHYMSPEQAAGAPIDHRTDIYSLGVIMYEMTSGQLPFNADNFMGILTQHMYKAPVPIRALVPLADRPAIECPPTLEAVVLKCMSKKPEQRYQSMEELRDDLEKVRAGGVPGAVGEMMARSGGFNVPADYFKHPSTALVPATPVEKRQPWPRIVWVAGALAAVGLVAGIFAIAQSTIGAPTPVDTSAPTATTSAPPVTTSVAPTVTQTAAPAPPKMITVLLDSDPSKGTATVGDKTIQLPDNILVEEGKTVSVEVKKAGYEPVTVEIDGKKAKEMVKLSPIRKTGGGAVKPPTTATGGNGVVDPWAKPKPKK
jgi:serine/threonine protein kinase